ncbi:MAG TPA: multidrug ABC transporter ATP-binding protein, partial [Clostridiaceae bacterium]|nr:multidrug ABC transporter ATP-binding protein [Clostridiaceae bacterium]
MESILVSKNLKKAYSGKIALNGLDMDIKLGRIVGLLGPNGSGKTT